MSDVRTSQLDYDLDEQVHADTPTRMKALADPLRWTILDLVLERAMTVTELAARLRRPKGSVAYHVKVLVESGLLRVVRTQKVRAIDERYYGRTGRTIVIAHEPGEIPFLQDMVNEIDLARADEAKDATSGFTLRHARIPRERADEYIERLYELSLEFVAEPREGDVEYGMYVAVFPTNRLVAPATDESERR